MMLKRWKPWIRWSLFAVSLVIVLVVVGAGVLYYQIRSIRVEDILAQQRQAQHAPETGDRKSPADAGSEDQQASPTLPKALSSPVDKASQFTSKPIKTQDALDVAAILLKSGLSLKQIYYLTGQADEHMSNEEKQKIRDLLLSKLSKDEIAALRSITTKYGKGLVILDPNYPIELVGVYDPEERKRIQQELEEKKKRQKQAESGAEKAETGAKGNDVSSVKEPDDRHPAQQEEKPSDKRSSGAIQKYEAELESLKTQCQSEVNSLKSQIQATVAQNKNVSADNLKSKFLQKFVEAEAQCDGRFQAILAQAAEAGVPEPVMQSWKATYESMKSSAQADILTAAEQLLKKN